MELKALYWPIQKAEHDKKKVDHNHRSRLRDKAWQIADLLRESDEIELLDAILRVLFSEGYPTAKARSEALEKIIRELGKIANPRYAKAIDAIGGRNLLNYDSVRAARTPVSYL
jgi:hypothetical protein